MMAPAGRQLARDPVMRALIRRHGPCELAPHGRSPYEALSRAIAHQQLNGRAAETILGRFGALFPNGRFPAPAAVLSARTTTLRRAGFSRAKVRALKDIARHALTGVAGDLISPACPARRSQGALQSLVRQVKETLAGGGSGEAPAPGHPAV
jgi:DNA-3-methyladenine glycosylase II